MRKRDRVTVISKKRRPRSSNGGEQKYVLCLYVTGSTPRSARSILNIHNLCEERLSGRYKLEVIDIYQQPDLARTEQIIAAPTLIKKLPLPLRKLVGDLSDQQRVVVGLDLKQEERMNGDSL
jgi:circadian clock protein KaiB